MTLLSTSLLTSHPHVWTHTSGGMKSRGNSPRGEGIGGKGRGRGRGAGGHGGVTVRKAVICYLVVSCCLVQLGQGYIVKREGEEMTKGTLEMAPRGHLHLREEEGQDEEFEVEPYMPPGSHMKPVSVQYFSSKLGEANTYHDVYRIFYGDDYSDEDIDRLLMTSHPGGHAHAQYRHGMSLLGAPRIGRLTGEQPHLEDINRALSHATQMAQQAECREPVAELINVRALAHDASKVYFPSCTVVHRCSRSTGCCNQSAECAPARTEVIRRSFIVGKYVKDTNGKMLLADQAVEMISFNNHTRCQCQPVKRIPTCLNCPYPFSLRRRNTTDCTCDCFADHTTCMRIKKGRKALTELALKCIKNGRCARPSCQYGAFLQMNIITGYCPRPDEQDEQDESNSGNDSDPTVLDTSVVKSEVSRRALQ